MSPALEWPGARVKRPSKPVGPPYGPTTARRLADEDALAVLEGRFGTRIVATDERNARRALGARRAAVRFGE